MVMMIMPVTIAVPETDSDIDEGRCDVDCRAAIDDRRDTRDNRGRNWSNDLNRGGSGQIDDGRSVCPRCDVDRSGNINRRWGHNGSGKHWRGKIYAGSEVERDTGLRDREARKRESGDSKDCYSLFHIVAFQFRRTLLSTYAGRFLFRSSLSVVLAVV